MSKSVADLIADVIYDKYIKPKLEDRNTVGWIGETLTDIDLRLLKLLRTKGKILRNVYIPKGEGETTEIDLLFITKKGIFVIESKNYSGWIFGAEKDRYWTASLPSGEKNRFFNPILQNKGHIVHLKEYLNRDIPYYSIVVFSNRCELKKITLLSDDAVVIKRDDIIRTVKKICDESPDILTDEDIDNICSRLSDNTNVGDEIKQKHIEDIERRYNSDAAETESDTGTDKTEIPSGASDMLCPRCGSKLVLRTARKGENTGQQFYGCSSFPKCRYIQNIKPKENENDTV